MIFDIDGQKALAWSDCTTLEQEAAAIPKTSGYYIALGGSTADLDNPTAFAAFSYSVTDCAQGDIFIVNATGATSGRAYGFLDSSSNIIERADAGATLTGVILIAPYGAAKLVINDSSGRTSYVGADPATRIRLAAESVKCLYKAFQRVGVIGDSLSVAYMWNKSTSTATTRMLAYSWVKQIGRECGVPWLNFGTSGQNVLTWCTNGTYGKVQMEAENNKCQAYIIGLGENDCAPASDTAHHVDLGTTADVVDNPDTVATTYYGGYNRIIQLLKKRNPACKIFCLTNANKSTTGRPRDEYNAAVRWIASTHYTTADNVYLIDLEAHYDAFFSPNAPIHKDGVAITSHFSAVGYEMIAEFMKRALNQVMLDHQTDFIDVAYVPCDTGEPTANTMTE